MTRFWIWFFLTAGGATAAFFGLVGWGTAVAGTWFSGVALSLHRLFGEEA